MIKDHKSGILCTCTCIKVVAFLTFIFHLLGGKHLFKVSCSDAAVSRHAHTLQANGDYDKKAWLDAFKSVVEVICSTYSKTTQV